MSLKVIPLRLMLVFSMPNYLNCYEKQFLLFLVAHPNFCDFFSQGLALIIHLLLLFLINKYYIYNSNKFNEQSSLNIYNFFLYFQHLPSSSPKSFPIVKKFLHSWIPTKDTIFSRANIIFCTFFFLLSCADNCFQACETAFLIS